MNLISLKTRKWSSRRVGLRFFFLLTEATHLYMLRNNRRKKGPMLTGYAVSCLFSEMISFRQRSCRVSCVFGNLA